MKRLFLGVLLVLSVLFGFGQEPDRIPFSYDLDADTLSDDALKSAIDEVLKTIGEIADVKTLDHTLQSRTVSKSHVKDKLTEYYEKSGIDFTTISSIALDEFWPKVANRRKYYSIVNGKIDTVVIDNDESFSINLRYTFVPNADSTQYSLVFSGQVNQKLIDFLQKKQPSIDIQQLVSDYFSTQPLEGKQYAEPKEAKADILSVLEGLFNSIYAVTKDYANELLNIQRQLEEANDEFLLASQGFHVQFEAYADQLYGFDSYTAQYAAWQDDYQFITMGVDQTPYSVAFKAIADNSSDKVVAVLVNIDKSTVSLDSITFISSNGGDTIAVLQTIGTNKAVLDLSGFNNNDKIYAIYQGDNPLGKLKIKSYNQKTKSVLIVPLTNGVVLDAELVKQNLDSIYQQAAVNWGVEIATEVFNPTGNDFYGKTFDNPEVNGLAKYTEQMKTVRDAYLKAHSDVNMGTEIIFVVASFEDPDIGGYMVRGRGLGFVTKAAITNNPTTLAHELGHGAFGLEHTFDELTIKTTDNLLDYKGGYHLTKRQWAAIHSILPTVSWFDSEEDGEFLSLVRSSNSLSYSWVNEQEFDKYYFNSFYTPGGQNIKLNDKSKLESNSVRFDLLTGGVSFFKYDNTVYEAYWVHSSSSGSNYFYGYVNVDYKDLIIEIDQSKSDVREVYSVSSVIPEDRLSEFYFTEFSYAQTNDVVLALMDNVSDIFVDEEEGATETECYLKNVIEIDFIRGEPKDAEEIHEKLAGSNYYNFPLKSVLKSISQYDVIFQYNSIDDDHTDLDLTTEEKEIFCRLTTIYNSTEKSFFLGRAFIERNNFDKGYTNLYQLANENLEYLDGLITIAELYIEIGDLIYSYVNDFTEENLVTLSRALVSPNLDYSKIQNRLESPSAFIDYLNNRKIHLKNSIELLNNATEQSIVLSVIQGLTTDEVATLDVTTRINAIKTANTAALWQNYIYDIEEALNLKLFKYVTPEFQEEFLSKLVSEEMYFTNNGTTNRTTILYASLTNIDGEYDIGNSSYIKLCKVLNEYITNVSNSGVNLGSSLGSIPYSKRYFRNISYKDFSDTEESINSMWGLNTQSVKNKVGQTKIQVYLNMQTSYIHVKRKRTTLRTFEKSIISVDGLPSYSFEYVFTPEETVNLHPYDLVVIVLENPEYLSVLGYNNTGSPSETLIVPAYYLELFKDEINDNDLYENAKTAGEITLALIPGGIALRAAIKAGRTSLIVYELASIGFDVSGVPNPLDLYELYNLVRVTKKLLTKSGFKRMFIGLSPSYDELFEAALKNPEIVTDLSKQDILEYVTEYNKIKSSNLEISIEVQRELDKYNAYFVRKKVIRRSDFVGGVVSLYGKHATRIDGALDISSSVIHLPTPLKRTFIDGVYRTGVTNKGVTLYRDFGAPDAFLNGGYAATTASATRGELAILDEWNSMRFKAKITVPQGQTLHVGKVGKQTSSKTGQVLNGGEDQVILPESWSTSWVDEITDVTTGRVYNSVEEFAQAFPIRTGKYPNITKNLSENIISEMEGLAEPLIKEIDELITADPSIISKFESDFPFLKNDFVGNVDLVDSWKYVSDLKISGTSKLTKDIDALQVIHRQRNSTDLMNKIGSDKYDDLIKNYAGQCKGCDPPSSTEAVKHLPPHDEMLENLETFANKHHGKDGFETVISDLKSTDPRKQKGAEFVSRILKNQDGVSAFEFKYLDDYDNTADFVFSGTKVDGKSWSVTGSIDNIGGWNLSKQLKDYFKAGDFEQWFDYSRFEKSTNNTYSSMSKAEATRYVKEQYQKLFQKQSKAQELLDYMGEAEFKNRFDVEDVDDFLEIIVPDLSNNELYGFIKVK